MKPRDSENQICVNALRAQLQYDATTGRFTWLVDKPGKHARRGNRAGRLRADGYRDLRILGNLVLEHRLAWFYVKGSWPENMIDHKNGVRDDNSWVNLRSATKSQNQANQTGHKNRRRPYTGVDEIVRAGGHLVWRATVRKNHKQHHLGYFETAEDAYVARIIAELELFGEHAGCLRPDYEL